ncbi:hypothetical protein [Pontimicrobium aquaticum]|uniref:hypothetical protein n=1 Tax=Pontimicrobium aquaticum TaxID=2565367 RepID=UPI001EF11321|nr:hypothetical protein [Pontimicrobium aquaticum]
MKKQYRELKTQEALFENIPKQLSLLKQKQVYYDSILLKYQLDGNSIQNSLLKTINAFSAENHLKVNGFLEPHVSTLNGVPLKTYQFSLIGEYNAIIKLIHKLEQQTKFGEIINVHFEKKKKYKTGKFYLEAFVLLRSFG